jgi:hypothetical protein
LRALGPGQTELDVDLLLTTEPTRVFRGKLTRDRIGGEVSADRENPDTEPGLLASVRIDGSDLPAGQAIPPELLVVGTETHARIRCGNHALGHSLFYGVWEFLCEKLFALA